MVEARITMGDGYVGLRIGRMDSVPFVSFSNLKEQKSMGEEVEQSLTSMSIEVFVMLKNREAIAVFRQALDKAEELLAEDTREG